MLSKLLNFLKKEDQQSSGVALPRHESMHFLLQLKDIVVGELICEDGIWYFQYSEQFKALADQYNPIVGFPDLDKVYKRNSLWPFFQLRIPGLDQPFVKKLIENEKLDIRNEAQLLKRFGRQTITNPFILKVKEDMVPA